jgi:hypothetical protein
MRSAFCGHRVTFIAAARRFGYPARIARNRGVRAAAGRGVVCRHPSSEVVGRCRRPLRQNGESEGGRRYESSTLEPIERPHPSATRGARISFGSWCEQLGRHQRDPSDVLGDGRARQRHADQNYVQSDPHRPLAHPFQPFFFFFFFFGLATFSRALSSSIRSPFMGVRVAGFPTPRVVVVRAESQLVDMEALDL